ncbi:hypothetical protein AAFC00_007276 [Neodothiora populina]|uniref:Uncharacterized protein n=1 Tax=Neodothiora populina TaxID=2781224 RepID=A0ABR3PHR3_9PEZI
MPIPDYGALPLAKTFLYVRGLALVSMVAIVGITANFVAEIVSTNVSPPKEIVGTLSITSIAALYCLISIALFYAGANLGLFIMTGIDSLLLIAFVVISVVVGKPISFLNCMAAPNVSSKASADGTASWISSLVANIKSGGTLGLYTWAGSTRANCYETKAIWGFCIALCILFTCSCILLPTLWFKAKRAGLIRMKDAA